MTKKNKGLKWNLSRRNGIKEPVKNIVEKSDSSVWTVNVAVAPEVLLLRLPSTKPECCLLVCRALRGFLARISPQKNENGRIRGQFDKYLVKLFTYLAIIL